MQGGTGCKKHAHPTQRKRDVAGTGAGRRHRRHVSTGGMCPMSHSRVGALLHVSLHTYVATPIVFRRAHAARGSRPQGALRVLHSAPHSGRKERHDSLIGCMEAQEGRDGAGVPAVLQEGRGGRGAGGGRAAASCCLFLPSSRQHQSPGGYKARVQRIRRPRRRRPPAQNGGAPPAARTPLQARRRLSAGDVDTHEQQRQRQQHPLASKSAGEGAAPAA